MISVLEGFFSSLSFIILFSVFIKDKRNRRGFPQMKGPKHVTRVAKYTECWQLICSWLPFTCSTLLETRMKPVRKILNFYRLLSESYFLLITGVKLVVQTHLYVFINGYKMSKSQRLVTTCVCQSWYVRKGQWITWTKKAHNLWLQTKRQQPHRTVESL